MLSAAIAGMSLKQKPFINKGEIKMNLHRADIIHLADVVLRAAGDALHKHTEENRTKIVDALADALIKITTTKG